MAFDKIVDSTVLNAGLTSIANAIRSKTEKTEKMRFPDGYVSEISALDGSAQLFPAFTYTGTYKLIDDGIVDNKQNWRIKFLTSGTLTVKRDMIIDAFLVGGGGGNNDRDARYIGGGGGGYTLTSMVQLQKDTAYVITIAAGGSPSVLDSGGVAWPEVHAPATSAFGLTANGGQSPRHYGDWATNRGGHGGSGGCGQYGTGGQDGADGTNGGSSTMHAGGTGQHTTTREFAESSGTLYSTGGSYNGAVPQANTGDGAPSNGGAMKGASGIVVIRNHRG